MNDQYGMISRRRACSLLGLVAALSALAPAMMLSEAEAQTAGMERRQERRVGRRERRETRREARRAGRETRREVRRGGGEPVTTGAAPTGSK